MSLQIKWSYLFILFFSFFLLSGCGTNNSQPVYVPDAGSSLTDSVKEVASMSIANGNTIEVDDTTGAVTIFVRALNKDNVLNTEGNITAQYQNTTSPSGIMTPCIASLIRGLATFNHIPPSNMDNLVDLGVTGTQFKFYSDNGHETSLNIMFKKVPTEPVEPGEVVDIISKIILSESSFTVTQSKETKEIAVYAFTSSGVGVETGEVELKYPTTAITSGIDAGNVPAKVTIKDGIGRFTYTAPTDLSKAASLSPASFRVQSSANANVYKNFSVSYAASSGTAVNPTIRIEGDNPRVIQQNSEQVDVILLVVDSQNRPLSEGTITVEYPGTSNVGVFATSEETIKNGQVTFKYTAPSSLVTGTSADFVFHYKENPASTPKTWSVQFSLGAPVVEDSEIYKLQYFGDTITVTKNSQNVPISIYGFDFNNAPVQSGTIKVSYPSENAGSVDIGAINPSLDAPMENGVANFSYTGPADLNRTFSNLAHPWVVYQFCDKTPGTTVQCADVNVTFAPDTAVQPDLQEYTIEFGVGTDNTLNLNALTPFNILLKNDAGEDVDKTRIVDVNITSNRPTLAVIADSNGNQAATLSFGAGKNPVDAYVKTFSTSGLVDFKVSVRFRDTEGTERVKTEIKSVVIFSGPPTTLSLTYNGSIKDVDAGTFKDEVIVHVSDQYNNPVNTEPEFTVSAIIGPASDPNHLSSERDAGGLGDFGYLYDLNGAGTITSIGGVTYFDTIGDHSFANIDINNDKLITFTPTDNLYKYPALGTWTILEIVSPTRLRLLEEYVEDPITPANNLRYVVGHNFRESNCNSTIGHYNVRVVPNGDVFKLDKTGTAKVNLLYDYPLVGADVFVAANILGYSNTAHEVVRIGNAYKRFLTGVGIKEVQEISYTGIGSGYWGHGSISVHIEETGYNMQYGYAHPEAKVGSKGYIVFETLTGFADGNSSNWDPANLIYDGRNTLDHKFTGCDTAAEYDVYITAKPGEEGTVTTYIPNLFTSELN